MKRKRMGLAAAVLLCLVLLASACQQKESGSAAKLEKATIVLDWSPNTNHTGIYAAKAKGYYEEEGLDVDIVLPGEANAEGMLVAGSAEFAVSYQESVTAARVTGVPIVSLAAVIQHNTSGFAAPVAKNIKSPKDFEGKTYGGWGAPIEQAFIESLMKAEGADFSKVTLASVGDADFFTAVERDIDFAWIFQAWTGIEAELRGVELDMIYLNEYSDKLDYYTPVIATTEQRIKDNPDLVKAFMKATAKGYEYAIENPEGAAELLLEAVPDLDRELVVASQKWLSPKYRDDAPIWGIQKREVWAGFAEWMDEHGLLEGEFNPDDAFTNDFLEE